MFFIQAFERVCRARARVGVWCDESGGGSDGKRGCLCKCFREGVYVSRSQLKHWERKTVSVSSRVGFARTSLFRGFVTSIVELVSASSFAPGMARLVPVHRVPELLFYARLHCPDL